MCLTKTVMRIYAMGCKENRKVYDRKEKKYRKTQQWEKKASECLQKQAAGKNDPERCVLEEL